MDVCYRTASFTGHNLVLGYPFMVAETSHLLVYSLEASSIQLFKNHFVYVGLT